MGDSFSEKRFEALPISSVILIPFIPRVELKENMYPRVAVEHGFRRGGCGRRKSCRLKKRMKAGRDISASG
jgi:hypothetical protein